MKSRKPGRRPRRAGTPTAAHRSRPAPIREARSPESRIPSLRLPRPHPRRRHRRIRPPRLRRHHRRPHRRPRPPQQGDDLLPLRQQARPLQLRPPRHLHRPWATASPPSPPPTPTRPTRLDRFVAAFVIEGQALAHVAPIMLREIAEGGRRLDEETYTVMVRVVRAMTGIVDRGPRRRTVRRGRPDPALPHHGLADRRLPRDRAHPQRRRPRRPLRRRTASTPNASSRIMQMLNRRALMPAAARRGHRPENTS